MNLITGHNLIQPKAIDAPLLELHEKQLGHLGAAKLEDLLTLLEEVRGRCIKE